MRCDEKLSAIPLAKLEHHVYCRVMSFSKSWAVGRVLSMSDVLSVSGALTPGMTSRAIGTEPHNVPRNFGFHQSSL
jgi:hypothetical protein